MNINKELLKKIKYKKEKMYPDYNKKNITIKKDGPSDNIKGRAQRKDKIQNNNYKQNINNNEKQFQNTKTKIKVTLFQNGFILNNGEFRDKRILIHYHG